MNSGPTARHCSTTNAAGPALYASAWPSKGTPPVAVGISRNPFGSFWRRDRVRSNTANTVAIAAPSMTGDANRGNSGMENGSHTGGVVVGAEAGAISVVVIQKSVQPDCCGADPLSNGSQFSASLREWRKQTQLFATILARPEQQSMLHPRGPFSCTPFPAPIH